MILAENLHKLPFLCIPVYDRGLSGLSPVICASLNLATTSG